MIETPAYIIDEKLLVRNLEILAEVQKSAGAKILLAQKCFSAFYFYPLIKKYLCGTASRGTIKQRIFRRRKSRLRARLQGVRNYGACRNLRPCNF